MVISMQNQIQPGMLCLIKAGRNAGRECTTVRTVMKGEVIKEMINAEVRIPVASDYLWLIQGPSVLSRTDILGEYRHPQGYALCPAEWLLPIGPPSNMTLTEVKKIKVPNQPELTV